MSNAQVERSCVVELCVCWDEFTFQVCLCGETVHCVIERRRVSCLSVHCAAVCCFGLLISDRTELGRKELSVRSRETHNPFSVDNRLAKQHRVEFTDMAVVNGLQTATGTQLENLINKCELILIEKKIYII